MCGMSRRITVITWMTDYRGSVICSEKTNSVAVSRYARSLPLVMMVREGLWLFVACGLLRSPSLCLWP